jgi:hypothetical protein
LAIVGRPPNKCDCCFEIIHASDVLDDVVTGTIPNIHAKREVGLRLHVAPTESNGCREHKAGTRGGPIVF